VSADGLGAGLARADADAAGQIDDEDFPVADVPAARALDDGVDRRLHEVFVDRDPHLDLFEQVDLGADTAIALGVAALLAAAHRVGYRDFFNVGFEEFLLYIVQRVWLYIRYYQFHFFLLHIAENLEARVGVRLVLGDVEPHHFLFRADAESGDGFDDEEQHEARACRPRAYRHDADCLFVYIFINQSDNAVICSGFVKFAALLI